jgi:transcriptional regulator with XRE-family HTH domain
MDYMCFFGTIVLMDELSKNLIKRMEELDLKQVQVAQRVNIDPKRFNNYVKNLTEPDFALFVQIAKALNTSPNILLGFDNAPKKKSEQLLRGRIDAALNVMDAEDQKVIAACADAILKTRKR